MNVLLPTMKDQGIKYDANNTLMAYMGKEGKNHGYAIVSQYVLERAVN